MDGQWRPAQAQQLLKAERLWKGRGRGRDRGARYVLPEVAGRLHALPLLPGGQRLSDDRRRVCQGERAAEAPLRGEEGQRELLRSQAPQEGSQVIILLHFG